MVGIVLSTVVLMILGELVPKNWAISRPLDVARIVAAPLCHLSAAFAPLIARLNNTNRFVRRRGLEPAEHLDGPRTPGLVALARHSSKAGARDPGTAVSTTRQEALDATAGEPYRTAREDYARRLGQRLPTLTGRSDRQP